MKLVRRASNGFTLIELIVVISVIGILASITAIGFTRLQQDGRDAQRASSVTSIVESLEKYFDANGEYPSCSLITGPAATVSNILPGLTSDVLTAPGDSSSNNSVRCEELNLAGADFFEYQGDGSQTCLTGGSCLRYTIRYKEESDNTIASINSRRNTDVATSGVPVLTAQNINFNDFTVSWGSIPNASQYRTQISTNNTFDGSDPVLDVAQTSNQFSGLVSGAQHWVRVQVLFTQGPPGQWSAVISPTTQALNASSLVATTNSTSQITVSWGAIANAVTYRLLQSTQISGGTLVNPTILNGITGTSSVRTGLTTGVTYHYQVRGINGANESTLSNISSATTFVSAPSCTTSTLNSNTQITIGWSAVPGATSYTSQRSTDNSNWTDSTNTAGLSQVFSGLNNGTTYFFRVQASAGSTPSAWASCPSRATGVSGPTGGWSAQAYGVRAWNAVTWMPGDGYNYGNWWTNGMYINAACSGGAAPRVQLQSYNAYSNNTSPNGYLTLSWTSSAQDRYVTGGTGSWKTWWHGWLACEVGGVRYGETYLGNAGPYG